jgi:hypothetical protein
MDQCRRDHCINKAWRDLMSRHDHTPAMHPATPEPDRAIVAAERCLHERLIALADFRRDLATLRLPLATAEDRLDHVDDLLAIVGRQLRDAWTILEDAAQGILADDTARFDNAANDDDWSEAAA